MNFDIAFRNVKEFQDLEKKCKLVGGDGKVIEGLLRFAKSCWYDCYTVYNESDSFVEMKKMMAAMSFLKDQIGVMEANLKEATIV